MSADSTLAAFLVTAAAVLAVAAGWLALLAVTRILEPERRARRNMRRPRGGRRRVDLPARRRPRSHLGFEDPWVRVAHGMKDRAE